MGDPSTIQQDHEDNSKYSTLCLNCGAHLTGPYCHICGQQAGHLHKPFYELFHDFLHSIAHFDGRLWTTLKSLIGRPGEITVHWSAGRQARYVPPIRLFVFTSLLLVLTLSISDVALILPEGNLRLDASVGKSSPQTAPKGPTTTTPKGEPPKSPSVAANGNISLKFLSIIPSQRSEAPFLETQGLLQTSQDAQARHIISQLSENMNNLARNPAHANKVIGQSLGSFMLLAVPFMSFLLLIFYIRQKRYLAEHILFSLNAHTFFFILLLGCVLLAWVSRGLIAGDWLLLGLWIVYSLHFLFALRRVYGQGWFKTIFKSSLITACYTIGLMACGIFILFRSLEV